MNIVTNIVLDATYADGPKQIIVLDTFLEPGNYNISAALCARFPTQNTPTLEVCFGQAIPIDGAAVFTASALREVDVTGDGSLDPQIGSASGTIDGVVAQPGPTGSIQHTLIQISGTGTVGTTGALALYVQTPNISGDWTSEDAVTIVAASLVATPA